MWPSVHTVLKCNIQLVQTAKVCAKGPGEECGGLWNTGGTCGDGLRNPLNSSVEYENGSRSLAIYIKIVVPSIQASLL